MKYLLFTGTRCAACPQMKHNLELARIDYEERNVDDRENWLDAGRYRVKSLPTLIVADDQGNPLGRYIGVRPTRELVQLSMRHGR